MSFAIMAGAKNPPFSAPQDGKSPKSWMENPHFHRYRLLRALLQGETIDRVPLFPHAYGFCARNVGYPPAVMYDDPKKSFAAQLWTFEQYGFDWGPMYGYASYGTWEPGTGGRIVGETFEGAPPHIFFPVQSEEDVDHLRLPDVRSAGRIPLALEFSKYQFERGSPITVVLGGNFTIAGNICPVELLCRWMLKKSDLVHRILRLATDHMIDMVRLWADSFGPECFFPQIGEALTSNDILSPRQFKDFVLPYLQESSEKILSMGVKHIFYRIGGEQSLNLPFWSQIPMGNPGICSVGSEVDLDTAIQYFGDTSIIAGNVDPRMILRGAPQQVYDLCGQAIEKGKRAPRGFMLMPGDEIPPDSPPYNVYMMRKAVDDFGNY
jgi:uroporphyrinogen decarboxylase